MVSRALFRFEGNFVLRKFFEFFILGGRGSPPPFFFKLFKSGMKVVSFLWLSSWNRNLVAALCCSDSKL